MFRMNGFKFHVSTFPHIHSEVYIASSPDCFLQLSTRLPIFILYYLCLCQVVGFTELQNWPTGRSPKTSITGKNMARNGLPNIEVKRFSLGFLDGENLATRWARFAVIPEPHLYARVVIHPLTAGQLCEAMAFAFVDLWPS